MTWAAQDRLVSYRKVLHQTWSLTICGGNMADPKINDVCSVAGRGCDVVVCALDCEGLHPAGLGHDSP